MCRVNGKKRRSASRSTSGRYTSRRCSSKTWSKFPTGWCRCTPNTKRTGSISGRLHALEIELPARAHGGVVAWGQGEAREQARFETCLVDLQGRARQLDRPGSGSQHDHGFDPDDVVEEPAAGSEHP